VFNATAVGADLSLNRRLSHFWNDSLDSEFIDPKAAEYDWDQNQDMIDNWKHGELEGDAGPSMKALWVDGWLHHLRRHLVADTLTRGGLGQLWTEGMYWFRYTLLDHDTAVNRANWMWLSAVAFSSKQKVYHYGEDYIKRSTHQTIDRKKKC
jgi:deoxyribodipyrimidine photolyase